ncbi:MAG: oligogalacturonate lyase family protein [Rhodospirillales bacterium]
MSAAKPRRLPAEWQHFNDPATEFPLLRLTNPAQPSYLPAYWNRAVSRRGDFLLFWSSRTGSPQVFQINLKSGELQQVTSFQDLDGATATLLPDDRYFCCFDGPSLRQVRLSNLKEREIYRVPEGFRRAGFSLAPDGSHALVIETRGGVWLLRIVPLSKGAARTLVESPEPLSMPLGSPGAKQILYRREEQLWMVGYDGTQNRPLPLAPGRTGPAYWSPGADSVLYLNFPEDKGLPSSIREYDLAAGADRLISVTAQYVHFTPNTDASVFLGASGSAASPYLVLMLRVTRRELPLFEHRSGRPDAVLPVFSPDSQSIFFHSDRDGGPAIYSASVEGIVERTEV